jgi:hypothetical protein
MTLSVSLRTDVLQEHIQSPEGMKADSVVLIPGFYLMHYSPVRR